MRPSPYRLIHSPAADRVIAAKRDGDEITVLYEGESVSKALWAVLLDSGVNVPGVVRDVAGGDYVPTEDDWDAR